jgi:hypothetical protein
MNQFGFNFSGLTLSNQNDPNQNMIITFTSYSTVPGSTLEGVFSGRFITEDGGTTTISNGKFRVIRDN